MEKELEIRRNLFHLIVGTALVILLYYNIVQLKHLFLIIIVGVLLSLISLKYNIPFLAWFLDKFERKENFPGKGALLMVLGCILSLGLFEKDIALAAITILTFGDSVSPLIGILYGKTKHPLNSVKLLEGSVAGIIVATFGATFFVSWLEAFLASFFAMATEAIEIRLGKHILDDNITVPIVAGLVIYIMRILLP